MSSPEDEKYYLRLLMHHVKKATSYEDMITVEGKKCVSFREVCSRTQLLFGDME